MEKYINTIKEEYFEDFPDPYLKQNKNAKRPHYFAYKGQNEKILWIIPLSSKVSKYEKIIRKKRSEGKPCDGVHVCKVGSRKQVFVIQDMFPITEEYIDSEYCINNIPYKLANERDIRIIDKKAKTVQKLHEKGVKVMATQPDVKKIESRLLEKIRACCH